MSKVNWFENKTTKIIITETRLEKVNYTYEHEGTLEQAMEWFKNHGNYAEAEGEINMQGGSELLSVDYSTRDA